MIVRSIYMQVKPTWFKPNKKFPARAGSNFSFGFGVQGVGSLILKINREKANLFKKFTSRLMYVGLATSNSTARV